VCDPDGHGLAHGLDVDDKGLYGVPEHAERRLGSALSADSLVRDGNESPGRVREAYVEAII